MTVPRLVLALSISLMGCTGSSSDSSDEVSEPLPATGSTLRFASLAVRDRPPSYEETLEFLEGGKTIPEFVAEWRETPEHDVRMRRYFADFFGVYVGYTPFSGFELVLGEEGTYSLAGTDYIGVPPKPTCTQEEALAQPAWWLEEGETILICPESASDAFTYQPDNPEDPLISCDSGYSQGLDEHCGCGPYQLLCMPCEVRGSVDGECIPNAGRNRELEEDFNQEPIERGMYVYENNLSWFDYFGGDFFYGGRDLYLYYIQMQGGLMTGEVDPDEVIQDLWAIPVDGAAVAPWPAGAERAGVVTSPGFLDTYNTFRGRARILSLALLCHDVDYTLNVDDYEEFRNPDLTQADVDHGSIPECAVCHYGMDNQASMLFGYDRDARSHYYYDIFPSQVGHVFGEDAEGPAALVEAYVERGPGFDACMANTAWTSLTGLSWEGDLTEAERTVLTNLAEGGPRPLVEGILTSDRLLAPPAE